MPYSLIRSGVDPDAPINEAGVTWASLIVEYRDAPTTRVLRRGHIVE